MQVSNAAGYLCHIQLQCRLDVTPEIVFEIFSHPDNAGAFRDIKKVGYRKVRVVLYPRSGDFQETCRGGGAGALDE
jgi:hypothetical protein